MSKFEMEKTKEIQLTDKETYPSDEVIKNVIGNAFPAYINLIDEFRINDLSHEWRYYNDGKAWLCKVQYKKKTIVWMSAWKGYIQATIYISDKSMDDIYNMDINEDIKIKIKNTKNVGKSKPCTFVIDNIEAIKSFKKIMVYKICLK